MVSVVCVDNSSSPCFTGPAVVGALPCGCKPLIRSIRRPGEFPLVATLGGNSGQSWVRPGERGLESRWFVVEQLLLSSDSPTIICYITLCYYAQARLPGGCITSVLLWEEEWLVFVLTVCRPLAQ